MLDADAIETIREYQSEIQEHGSMSTPFHVSPKGAVALKFPSRETLKVFSLTQLVNAVKSELRIASDEHFVVNVKDQLSVDVMADTIDDNLNLEVIVSSDFSKVFSPFPFEKQMSQEEFIINLMTKFEETELRQELLRFISSVKQERVGVSDDDGFSQEASVRAGVHLAGAKTVRNYWPLKTYKTFPEVEQPVIPYILRLHQREDEMPKFALYECDGGKWKVDTTIAVREWLINRIKNQLAEAADRVTVL